MSTRLVQWLLSMHIWSLDAAGWPMPELYRLVGAINRQNHIKWIARPFEYFARCIFLTEIGYPLPILEVSSQSNDPNEVVCVYRSFRLNTHCQPGLGFLLSRLLSAWLRATSISRSLFSTVTSFTSVATTATTVQLTFAWKGLLKHEVNMKFC